MAANLRTQAKFPKGFRHDVYRSRHAFNSELAFNTTAQF